MKTIFVLGLILFCLSSVFAQKVERVIIGSGKSIKIGTGKGGIDSTVRGSGDSSGISYFFQENFEGANIQWGLQNNPLKVVFQNTNVIEGSFSLACQGGEDPPPYAFTTNGTSGFVSQYFSNDVVEVFFLFKAYEGPTVDDFAREFAWIVSQEGNSHLLELDLHRITSTSYRLRVYSGVAGSSITGAGFELGSTNAIWLKYTAGSGANAIAEVWWAPAADLANIIKPSTSDTDHYAIRSDGNYVYKAGRLQLGSVFRASHGVAGIYDRVRMSIGSIGSNP
jgi:hypothetical protein